MEEQAGGGGRGGRCRCREAKGARGSRRRRRSVRQTFAPLTAGSPPGDLGHLALYLAALASGAELEVWCRKRFTGVSPVQQTESTRRPVSRRTVRWTARGPRGPGGRTARPPVDQATGPEAGPAQRLRLKTGACPVLDQVTKPLSAPSVWPEFVPLWTVSGPCGLPGQHAQRHVDQERGKG